jgi:hypothetical protein
VAGAAGSACRQAARVGLLAALWVGCAKVESPPGGPPDFTSPVILSIAPDSGAELEGFDDDFEIRFDEVISERSAGGLENVIRVAPRPRETQVGWKRSRITVKPKGGWYPGVVYQVRLLPGVTDLRNNRLDTTLTVVFSTGGGIPDTRLEGTVVDWEAGTMAARALVEAVLLPDSLVYFTEADSSGGFDLAAIPAGNYVVFATVDQNDNGLRESRESFDSTSVRLDSTASHVFWTFAHDTTGPRLRNVAEVDSFTVRLELGQMPDPAAPIEGATQVFALPDSTPVAIAHVWNEAVYDSVSAVEQAIADSLARLAADSLRADSLAADSLAADSVAADSAEADTTATQPVPETDTSINVITDSAALLADSTAAADSVRMAEILALRPKLHAVYYVRLASPLEPGARYVIVVRATNLFNAMMESQMQLSVRALPDST